ncbi:MAG: hypothetical protein KAW84_08670 [Thermoplasmata archaeon]|nr:hypothetical protein [Thermoplasmata archaeon]
MLGQHNRNDGNRIQADTPMVLICAGFACASHGFAVQGPHVKVIVNRVREPNGIPREIHR